MNRLLIAALIVCSFLLGGCMPRIKSLESHNSAVTRDEPGAGKGDKYTNGGIASASGGTRALTSQATSQPKFGTQLK